jgi:hypothetical protein
MCGDLAAAAFCAFKSESDFMLQPSSSLIFVVELKFKLAISSIFHASLQSLLFKPSRSKTSWTKQK